MSLSPIHREPASRQQLDTNSNVSWRESDNLRRAAGAFGVIALVINLALARMSIGDAQDADASAIQIIQVWTPLIYYAVLITGLMIALYIYSRASD